jgi:hypothetical protein
MLKNNVSGQSHLKSLPFALTYTLKDTADIPTNLQNPNNKEMTGTISLDVHYDSKLVNINQLYNELDTDEWSTFDIEQKITGYHFP